VLNAIIPILFKMEIVMAKNSNNKEGAIIGGSVLMGVGIGFALLELSPLFFLASILTGLGFGLVVSQFVSNK